MQAPRHRLTEFVAEAISKATDPGGLEDREKLAQASAEIREKNTARWYKEGGYWVLAWAKKYYRTWKGTPLDWLEPYLPEFLILMGTPNVEGVVVEKGSQMGFSEILFCLLAFALSNIRIPLGMGFEEQGKVNLIVPRIQSTFDAIEPLQKIKQQQLKSTGRSDVDSKTKQITIGGIPCSFFYAGVKSAKSGAGEREASSSTSSWMADMVLMDEIALFPAGAIDIAKERQSACKMPTKVNRMGSTPGMEGGIVDLLINQSRYVFQWEVKCPHCGESQFLDAFGNLLIGRKAQESEEADTKYVDELGRPYKWFCKDSSTRQLSIETAYIGCVYCEGNLDRKALDSGHFRCRKTGKKLLAVVNEVLQSQKMLKTLVGLRLPRLASVLFDPAERIKLLLETRNPADQLQQGLGKSVTVGASKISLPKLQACINLDLPLWANEEKPDLISAGFDQGQASQIGVAIAWWFPPEIDPKEQAEVLWREAHTKLIWFGNVKGFPGILTKAKSLNASLIGMDMEPEKIMSTDFAREHPPKKLVVRREDNDSLAVKLGSKRISTQAFGDGEDIPTFIFDEVSLKGASGKGQAVKRSTRLIQGKDEPMYAVDRTFSLDAVRNRIYSRRVTLPDGLVYEPQDPENLLLHYLASDRNSDGIWTAQPGRPDHYHHAHGFAESVVFAALFEPDNKRRVYFGSFSK
jgi:hypothetical protein